MICSTIQIEAIPPEAEVFPFPQGYIIAMNALQQEIAALLMNKGASLVGFADITGLPDLYRHSMRSALSIAAALDPGIIRDIVSGPTMQYYEEYRRVNELLSALCREAVRFLGDHGIGAIVIEPTVKKVNPESLATSFQHKTAATRAGLGWVGKSDLLITRKYGAAHARSGLPPFSAMSSSSRERPRTRLARAVR